MEMNELHGDRGGSRNRAGQYVGFLDEKYTVSSFGKSLRTSVAASGSSATLPSPYPSLQSTASSSTLVRDPAQANFPTIANPNSTSKGFQLTPAHKPIPAKTVFARAAYPLHLPALDAYLGSLSAPSFGFPAPSWGAEKGKKKKKSKSTKMFPPMDRLAATKKSIQDLETNSVVASAWKNRNSIFGALVSAALGIAGSSVVAAFYSLQGILDTMQVFALLLSTIIPNEGTDLGSKWKQLLLGTIPNILALNPGSNLTQSIIFLALFMTLAALLLYYFYISTSLVLSQQRDATTEGLRPALDPSSPNPKSSPGRGWDLLVVTFILTVLYLPLSTIAVHAVVWSSDFWVVPNPYINATSYPPQVAPLGPSDQFRDPLDFCWTTTMRTDEVNWAPAIVIFSAVGIIFMTLWFPYRLRKVIQQVVPVVDQYNELGTKRTSSEMDREYLRLLNRDRNALTFLYSDFRLGWGTYKPLYLVFKLVALLIVAVINPSTCLFRTIFPPSIVSVSRSSVLLFTTIVFLGVQCWVVPFTDPVNNAGEWISRVNYVLTSAIGLYVALDLAGEEIVDTYVLYFVYFVTYGLSFYFTIVHASWARRLMKTLTHRLDFSIDIFSPRLDISSSSIHVKRRIWQESLTALFLTSPDCRIPDKQPMQFAQARDAEYPPYLLEFAGSPGERFVENLKTLREVGTVRYAKGLATISAGEVDGFHKLQALIQKHYIGPDCYYHDLKQPEAGSLRRWGNAWWIPFPPTLAFRYDDGPLVVLQEVTEFREYVKQNQHGPMKKSRAIRMALRALDGKIVTWPYDYLQPVGAQVDVFACCRRQYEVHKLVRYESGTLSIKHSSSLPWKGAELASGFEIELKYTKDVVVDGSTIGLNDDFELTPALARFFAMNHVLISENLPKVQFILQDYRDELRKECVAKATVLSYRFLLAVYDRPQKWDGLVQQVKEERDVRVKELIVANEIAVEVAYKRYRTVTSSEVRTWWYIFWDDLWRRNYDVFSALTTHEEDFCPHYPTSIAYKPISRPVLEAFLVQRGLLSKPPKTSDIVHSGILNKMYLRLNEIVFRGSSHGIMFHLGDDVSEADLEEIDMDIDRDTETRPSTLGTGGGTDHDEESILFRPAYRWEGILNDSLILDSGSGTIDKARKPVTRKKSRKQKWKPKWGVWFGIKPHWRAGTPSKGLALDVRLVDGKYVLLEPDNTEVNSQMDPTSMTNSKDLRMDRLALLTTKNDPHETHESLTT